MRFYTKGVDGQCHHVAGLFCYLSSRLHTRTPPLSLTTISQAFLCPQPHLYLAATVPGERS
jgi:hypothetical protein